MPTSMYADRVLAQQTRYGLCLPHLQMLSSKAVDNIVRRLSILLEFMTLIRVSFHQEFVSLALEYYTRMLEEIFFEPLVPGMESIH